MLNRNAAVGSPKVIPGTPQSAVCECRVQTKTRPSGVKETAPQWQNSPKQGRTILSPAHGGDLEQAIYENAAAMCRR